jgi:hypothetical protein
VHGYDQHRPLRVRFIAVLLGALAQIPLLFFGFSNREPPRSATPETQLVMLPDTSRTPPPLRLIAPSIREQVAPDTAIHVPVPSLAPSVEPLDRDQRNWGGSAAAAVQSAVEEVLRREGYRRFGRTQDAPKQQNLPSPFAPPPKHHLGMIDDDEPGVTLVWLSDNCYIKIDKFVSARATDLQRIPRCVVPLGRKEARGDLFEHMKQEGEQR